MFAIRHRSRPRRATRFAPTFDGLSSRIAPTSLVTTIDFEADQAIVTEPPPPTDVPPPPTEVDPDTERLIGLLRRMNDECGTTSDEI